MLQRRRERGRAERRERDERDQQAQEGRSVDNNECFPLFRLSRANSGNFKPVSHTMHVTIPHFNSAKPLTDLLLDLIMRTLHLLSSSVFLPPAIRVSPLFSFGLWPRLSSAMSGAFPFLRSEVVARDWRISFQRTEGGEIDSVIGRWTAGRAPIGMTGKALTADFGLGRVSAKTRKSMNEV